MSPACSVHSICNHLPWPTQAALTLCTFIIVSSNMMLSCTAHVFKPRQCHWCLRLKLLSSVFTAVHVLAPSLTPPKPLFGMQSPLTSYADTCVIALPCINDITTWGCHAAVPSLSPSPSCLGLKLDTEPEWLMQPLKSLRLFQIFYLLLCFIITHSFRCNINYSREKAMSLIHFESSYIF